MRTTRWDGRRWLRSLVLEGAGVALVAAVMSAVCAGAAEPSQPATTSKSGEPAVAARTASGTRVLLVVGAGGESEFASQFQEQADRWRAACERARCDLTVVGVGTNQSGLDVEQLEKWLAAEPKSEAAELWVVLIGHGTFDGKEAKFNLRGSDVSASQLAGWLKPFTRPLVVLNLASASGPFLPALSVSNRVVITATRSGNEKNFARLGRFLSQTLTEAEADLDQDGQTSLLEAYLSAAAQVAEFYKTEGRLATEHSLIDDNGDGLGTPPDWFRGLRPTKRPKDSKAGVDGLFAHQRHLVRSEAEAALDAGQRARRDRLERDLDQLRSARATLAEDEYFRRLEAVLLELASVYEPAGEGASSKGAEPSPGK